MNEDGILKPNQEYTTGENGYTYKTDSNGNIVSAHADELKFKTHEGRLKHNFNTPNKLPGDDAGHIFADQSRPSSFKVSYKIDGVKIRKHFKN